MKKIKIPCKGCICLAKCRSIARDYDKHMYSIHPKIFSCDLVHKAVYSYNYPTTYLYKVRIYLEQLTLFERLFK